MILESLSHLSYLNERDDRRTGLLTCNGVQFKGWLHHCMEEAPDIAVEVEVRTKKRKAASKANSRENKTIISISKTEVATLQYFSTSAS